MKEMWYVKNNALSNLTQNRFKTIWLMTKIILIKSPKNSIPSKKHKKKFAIENCCVK